MPFDPNTPRSRDEVLLQAIVSGDSSAMGDPRDREEEFVKAIADKETLPDYSEASEGDTLQIGADGPEWGPVDALPDYSGASAGDALVIGNDGPEWGAVPNELPAIAAGDAGKVLKVNSSETGTEWGAAGGESKKYYYHFLKFNYVSSGYNTFYAQTQIISSSSTPFSSAIDFAKWLYDNNYKSSIYVYTVVAINKGGTIPAGEVIICEGVYSTNGTQVSVNYKALKVENNALNYETHTVTVGSMTDTVSEI